MKLVSKYKPLVGCVLGLAIPVIVWAAIINYGVRNVADRAKNAPPIERKPVEFARFDSQPLLGQQRPVQMNGFQGMTFGAPARPRR